MAKQVEEELLRVNARFSALHGASGVRDLDLYGRAPAIVGGSQEQPKQEAPAAGLTWPDGSGSTSSPSTRLKLKASLIS